MIRLLIGSSNVAGTYSPEKFKGYPPYKMAKCTRIEVFKALMDDIKDEKEVIIAVIENFICDAVRAVPEHSEDLIDGAIDSTIKEFMYYVENTATKNPMTRFALAQPILRPRHSWYSERYEGICRSFVSGVNALARVNVSKLEAMTRTTQNFVSDEIHLTKDSSFTYVNGLLYNADLFFTAELIDLEEGPSKKPEERQQNVKGDPLETIYAKSVKELEKSLEELNRSMFKRRFHDNLVMSRIREDVDTISNTNKEDRILISGMTSKVPRPSGREEIKGWLREMVSTILESIEKGSSQQILFISQGRSDNRDIPLAEVRMTSKEIAIKLRKSFAQKKKTGQDFGRIYIANCVTLATRVRIEIMKAMSKKFSSDKEELYVIGYASRPVLHVKSKEKEQNQMWLGFSDALVSYGPGLEECDLGNAYRKAGVAFRGQLQQNFVVLHDPKQDKVEKQKTGRIAQIASEVNLGSPRKRLREESEQGQGEKNAKKLV